MERDSAEGGAKVRGIHIELDEADLKLFRKTKPEYGALSHVLRGLLKAWLQKHAREG